MKTIDRYVAGIFTKNLVLAIFAMTSLFLFQSMFTDLYDHNHPIQQTIFYHWLNVPRIAAEMAPSAVLMATVLTLSGLSRTHELIACFAIGIGIKRLMTVMLGLVLILTGISLYMQGSLLPSLFRIRTNYYWREMQKRPDFFLDIKRDKIWYRSRNMIYNLQRFDTQSRTIYGMSIYTFDENFNLTQVIAAERAEFSEKGWKLENGSVSVFTEDDPFPLTKSFEEKEVVISESPKDFQEIEKEVDGLTFKELSQYIKRMKAAGADTKSYEVKYQARISVCFISIVMCFLAVPFSLTTRREGGLAKDLGLCLGITFSYWLFYSVGLSLGNKGVLMPWMAAWMPSFIFLSLATVLILRKQ